LPTIYVTPSSAWPGVSPVRDAQAAQMDVVVPAVLVLRRNVFGVGVQKDFRKRLANFLHARDMVGMRMRDEQMLELELVLLD